MKEKLEKIQQWVKEWAAIAAVDAKYVEHFPGQPLVSGFQLYAPVEALGTWKDIPGALVLSGNFGFDERELTDSDETKIEEMVRCRFITCMIAMWEKATWSNEKHNMELLDALQKEES